MTTPDALPDTPTMKLFGRADGIRGHFCIGRLIAPDLPYWEFYNKGQWLSAGQLFTSRETAEFKMQQLAKKEPPHDA